MDPSAQRSESRRRSALKPNPDEVDMAAAQGGHDRCRELLDLAQMSSMDQHTKPIQGSLQSCNDKRGQPGMG